MATTEREIEVQTYRLRVRNRTLVNSNPRPQAVHHFIMEALTEGRIDLAQANVMLGQCRLPGEASEL